MADDMTKKMREQRDLAFYQASVSTWYALRMEQNRHILTLSSFAIGLLMTFLSEFEGAIAFRIWLIASSCFGVSIAIALRILGKSSDHIKMVVQVDIQPGEKELESSLKFMSNWLYIVFIAGVVATLLLVAHGQFCHVHI